mmetsp:Transcript_27211/g.54517  ORF Transcript_27211/g.54517 Transcript_27211/m.54517 type:complete len:321 (-) Transcript_27211:98-1060(-)
MESFDNLPIEATMTIIFVGLCMVMLVLSTTLSLRPDFESVQSWLPTKNNANKREFEIYALHYTVVWIGVFMLVILWQVYEHFTADSYMYLCVPLAAPFLLQPILFPTKSEVNLPLTMRYSFKANVWLAIFSFVGNYWYTHYFYTVLKAQYSFPAHRLNDVPIALYFATHFYFVTYHTFSNLILRRIETRYLPGTARTVFFWAAVCVFSYFTAFMETLTISNFPYYSFQDRYMAYTLGSAFYGLYFLVSFPVFYRIDEKVGQMENGSMVVPHTMFQTVFESLGTCMLVLILLDAGRLYCGIDFEMSGVWYYVFQPATYGKA